jgi:hypothetical protein
MCAEIIPADAALCPYCGTRFGEKVQAAPPPAAPAAPANVPPASYKPPVVRKSRAKGCATRISALMIILAGVTILLWTQRANIPALSGLFVPPTRTIIPTLLPTHTPTAIPTRTPRPTATATPTPEMITFDTIGTYPEGQLVTLSGFLEMFKSTYCDSECGLLLAEYSGSTNKITIFVRVAKEGVDPSPNQMKALPNSYSQWDIVVCLDDGTLAYIGNRITVTGRICKTTTDKPCISNIIKIEKENR